MEFFRIVATIPKVLPQISLIHPQGLYTSFFFFQKAKSLSKSHVHHLTCQELGKFYNCIVLSSAQLLHCSFMCGNRRHKTQVREDCLLLQVITVVRESTRSGQFLEPTLL